MNQLQSGDFKELERCELKYHIPLSMVGEIQKYIALFCEEDKYSKIAETGFYRVRSLYLDNEKMLFYKWKQAKKADRFSMRIRAYGEAQVDEHFFLEVKRKRSNVVKKYRSVLKTKDLHFAIEDEIYSTNDEKNTKLFVDKKIIHGARPVLITSYLRNAWFGKNEDYARVTFDRELRHEVCREYRLDRLGEYASDYENYFDKDCSVVLELKAQIDSIPLWMRDLTKEFGLVKNSFSKFGNAVKESKKREGKFWL